MKPLAFPDGGYTLQVQSGGGEDDDDVLAMLLGRSL